VTRRCFCCDGLRFTADASADPDFDPTAAVDYLLLLLLLLLSLQLLLLILLIALLLYL